MSTHKNEINMAQAVIILSDIMCKKKIMKRLKPFHHKHTLLKFFLVTKCACIIQANIQFFFISFRLICRVLKPPGGGSSDLFGGSVPSTPRSTRNNMASNIFATPNDVKNGNGKLYATLVVSTIFIPYFFPMRIFYLNRWVLFVNHKCWHFDCNLNRSNTTSTPYILLIFIVLIFVFFSLFVHTTTSQ